MVGMQNLKGGRIICLVGGIESSLSHYLKKISEELQSHKKSFSVLLQERLLFPNFTVFQNIEFVLRTKKYKAREIEQRIHFWMDILRLSHLKDRFLNEISGGEAQRVSLAKTLAVDNEYLLFEEPLKAIDFEMTNHLRVFLKKYIQEKNIACLWVTHSSEEAGFVGDEIFLV
jgi:ABC-type Fe3+/spermidine/putrescine transport system ATPase subunit